MANFRSIKYNQKLFALGKVCKVFQVSKSGFYSWSKGIPSKRALSNLELLSEIKTVCHWGKKTYGSLRIARALHQRNIPVYRQRVARLMKKGNIRGVIKKRFKAILILDISIQYRKTGWGGISGPA